MTAATEGKDHDSSEQHDARCNGTDETTSTRLVHRPTTASLLHDHMAAESAGTEWWRLQGSDR
jgi:hypothetical protein